MTNQESNQNELGVASAAQAGNAITQRQTSSTALAITRNQPHANSGLINSSGSAIMMDSKQQQQQQPQLIHSISNLNNNLNLNNHQIGNDQFHSKINKISNFNYKSLHNEIKKLFRAKTAILNLNLVPKLFPNFSKINSQTVKKKSSVSSCS